MPLQRGASRGLLGKGGNWSALQHLASKAPGRGAQVQLHAQGPVLHSQCVNHDPSVCFYTATSDILLGNHWNWPSQSFCTALGPNRHADAVRSLLSLELFNTIVEIIGKIMKCWWCHVMSWGDSLHAPWKKQHRKGFWCFYRYFATANKIKP